MLFFYTARTQEGETVTGTSEAASENDLNDYLKQQGLYLLFSEKREKTGIAHYDLNRIFSFLFGISHKDKIVFARNLAVMINAGMPLTRSLQTLAIQTKNPMFKDALLAIASEIAKGNSFGETLKRYPDIFSDIFINMVIVGETTGNLDDVLNVLAEQMQKDYETRSKVIGSLTYPAVIIVAMLGIGIFMMVYVVPQITSIFEEMNVELPVMTQVIVKVSKFLEAYWYIAIAGVGLGIFALRAGMKVTGVKKVVDFILLRLPVAGEIIRKVNSARISRNLSSLLKSGMSLTRSIEIIEKTTANYFFSDSMRKTKEAVEKGVQLHKVLARYPDLYPSMVTEMIAVGEETGALTELLVKVASFYEQEVDQITKNMASIIEPVLMVIIGVAVGFFAVSMIQPMYSITQGV